MIRTTLVLFFCMLFLRAGSQEVLPSKDVLRLSEALQFATISSDTSEKTIHQSFLNWLENTFGELHSRLEISPINNLSRLYHWKGTDSRLNPALFLMHYDVVPVSDPAMSTHPPFAGS